MKLNSHRHFKTAAAARHPSLVVPFGFTLTELILVLLLLGLAASMTVLSIRRPLQESAYRRVIQKLVNAEYAEREMTRRLGRGGGWFWNERDRAIEFTLTGKRVSVNSPVHLIDLQRWTQNRWVSTRKVSISAAGQSPTIRLRWGIGPAASPETQFRVHLLGVSGRWMGLGP